MPTNLSPKPAASLSHVLQHQIMPQAQQFGMSNIVVARPSLRHMLDLDDDLPRGASLTHKPLQSKQTPFKMRKSRQNSTSVLVARWPKDRLNSSRTSILMFAIGGRVAIPLGDYMLHCTPYQGALILPGTPHPDGTHLCIGTAADFCDMLSFRVLEDGVWGWINHSREGRHWGGGVPAGEGCYVRNLQARKYLETLTEEAQMRPAYFRETCDNLLRLFITLVLREIQEQRGYQPPPLSSAALSLGATPLLGKQNFTARVEEYVRENLHRNLSIDRIASHLFMSRASFTRQFRTATGKTFNQYVTEARLEAAKVLLQSTDWPINKISDYVGVTPARLRVLFRKHQAVSPGKFREKVRNP